MEPVAVETCNHMRAAVADIEARVNGWGLIILLHPYHLVCALQADDTGLGFRHSHLHAAAGRLHPQLPL